MSRTTYAATAANLAALIADGFPAPVGLVEAVEEQFADRYPSATPLQELRTRLDLARGGESGTDAQSPALRALAATVTPEQVWDLLIELDAADTFAMSTRVWVCLRDGLLPHGRRILALLSRPGTSQRLVRTALEGTFQAAAYSWCDALCEQHAGGQVSDQDLAEAGHSGCVPLTRVEVFEVVRDHDVPVHERMSYLFDRPTWTGHSRPGPRTSGGDTPVPDALLNAVHDVVAAAVEPAEVWYTDAWVATLRWFCDYRHTRHDALTQEQGDRLLTERPGLASDLLVTWLGRGDREHTDRMVREHILPFLVPEYSLHDSRWQAWLGELVQSGHRSLVHLDLEVLDRVIVRRGNLTTVPWSIRRSVLARRTDWLVLWLASTRNPADPAEVRQLVQDGTISAHFAYHAHRKVSVPGVARELLNARGLAAYVAKEMGDSARTGDALAPLHSVLAGMLDLMPDDEVIRTRLMRRVLLANADLNGPLDGDAQLEHGLAVLTDRWAAQRARLTRRA